MSKLLWLLFEQIDELVERGKCRFWEGIGKEEKEGVCIRAWVTEEILLELLFFREFDVVWVVALFSKEEELEEKAADGEDEEDVDTEIATVSFSTTFADVIKAVFVEDVLVVPVKEVEITNQTRKCAMIPLNNFKIHF